MSNVVGAAAMAWTTWLPRYNDINVVCAAAMASTWWALLQWHDEQCSVAHKFKRRHEQRGGRRCNGMDNMVAALQWQQRGGRRCNGSNVVGVAAMA